MSLLALAAIVTAAASRAVAVEDPIFTYQGVLKKNGVVVGSAAGTTCTFDFGYFTAASGGAALDTQSDLPVVVRLGIFSVDLVLERAHAARAPLWMEVSVRCPGDGQSTILGRQPLRAAPFAIDTICVGNGPTDEMVRVGSLCVDQYEASLWDAPQGGTLLPAGDAHCSKNGTDCDNIFARSEPNRLPMHNLTWLQAQQACANVGKRLPTNAEWQMAAAGTPDDVDSNVCNFSNVALRNTGANMLCASRWNVIDMVGNVAEYVADWLPTTQAPGTYPLVATNDLNQYGVDPARQGPYLIARGGRWTDLGMAGPLSNDAVGAVGIVSGQPNYGFRCVR